MPISSIELLIVPSIETLLSRERAQTFGHVIGPQPNPQHNSAGIKSRREGPRIRICAGQSVPRVVNRGYPKGLHWFWSVLVWIRPRSGRLSPRSHTPPLDRRQPALSSHAQIRQSAADEQPVGISPARGMVPWLTCRPCFARYSPICAQRGSPGWWISGRWRNLHIVVSSDTGSRPRSIPTNCRSLEALKRDGNERGNCEASQSRR